ncbi:MAG: hypothetical protein JXA96_15885 [Sedimentisphaerales bacterium]|nr:hypothetical protein [Sedimentisphaerales bacterium]
MQPIFIFVIITVGIIAAALYFIAEEKRRRAMSSLAEKLGLRFYIGKQRGIIRKYSFINKFHQGRDKYAYNSLYGNFRNHEVNVFDYHYTTGHGKNTQHHHLSFFLIEIPMVFPELTIVPEGVFSKIGQALGYDDIDFESHEFSRKYCVRSKDKKFAYDVCNAKMIDYLLSNTGLSIEIESNVLAIYFNRRLAPENIEKNLYHLIEIRSLIPDYLFNRR